MPIKPQSSDTFPIAYTQLSILIPFYNEKDRLPNVLQAILPYIDASMVLCVNDGSTDGGDVLIAKDFPAVHLISVPKNSGKSAAVRFGLEQVKSEYVMLLDADLENLNGRQLAEGIIRFRDAIESGKQIDMLIFRRSDDPVHYKVVRADVLFSGERILRTAVLQEIYKKRKFEKYQLELFINDMLTQLEGQVYWVPLQSKNPDKLEKWSTKKSDAVQGTLDLMVGTFSSPETIKMITQQYLEFGMKEL